MSPAPGPVDLRIRPVGPFDLDVIAALHAACFAKAWDRQSIAALLAMPGAFGLLAEDTVVPTGFLMARVTADEAEILSLAVAGPARRSGRGTRLLEAGLARMAGAGARRVHLEVAEDNSAAIAFYRALEFRPVGRRAGYYRGRDGTVIGALLLSRPLAAASSAAGGG